MALLGRNGVGKTTFLATVMGLLKPISGRVRLQGRELAGAPANVVARAGMATVPQSRRVFADLTVEQNLQVADAGDRQGAAAQSPAAAGRAVRRPRAHHPPAPGSCSVPDVARLSGQSDGTIRVWSGLPASIATAKG